MFIASVVFIVALLGIAGLFALKSWEEKNSRKILPGMRDVGDMHAARLKHVLGTGIEKTEQLPPLSAQLLRTGVQKTATGFGHLAHWAGERSHALADLVSHKHRFERRETRSEFLKTVMEHPLRTRLPGQGGMNDITPAHAHSAPASARPEPMHVPEPMPEPVPTPVMTVEETPHEEPTPIVAEEPESVAEEKKKPVKKRARRVTKRKKKVTEEVVEEAGKIEPEHV